MTIVLRGMGWFERLKFILYIEELAIIVHMAICYFRIY